MENSIGDRIEEKYTRYINCETDILDLTLEEAKFILETDERRNYVTSILQEAGKVILSDYKRVLKENEILKKEKEQAWEEWNNLEQGSYETEQKLKQQIKESQKENEEWDRKFCNLQNLYFKLQDESESKRKEWQEAYKSEKKMKNEYVKLYQDLLLKENVIPIQKVKDKIEEYKNMLKTCNKAQDIDRIKAINERVLELQELLESEKQK